MTDQLELAKVRAQFEEIARDYQSEPGWAWRWDATRMHLTIYDSHGVPFATLHIELKH